MLEEVENEITKLERIANVLRGIETGDNHQGAESHGLSASARRKISLAQKARWAAKKSSAQPAKAERVISLASRRKMAAAQRARWTKVKAQTKKAA
jgi:hypothetical protein